MRKLILLYFLMTQASFAQERPNTPFWSLVKEVENTGLVPYQHFNWSERSFNKLLNEVPTLRKLRDEVRHRKIVYRTGGENPGKMGFTTLLKSGDLFVQVYYAKHLKNIDIALTLGHELIHAIHIDSGLHDMWKSLVLHKKKEYAECQSEIGAYTWSSIYASNQSTRNWISKEVEHYYACTKKISELR